MSTPEEELRKRLAGSVGGGQSVSDDAALQTAIQRATAPQAPQTGTDAAQGTPIASQRPPGVGTAPQPAISGGSPHDGYTPPIDPGVAEETNAYMQYRQSLFERREMNPSEARTVGEFFEFSAGRGVKQLSDVVNVLANANAISTRGVLNTIDNADKALRDATGLDIFSGLAGYLRDQIPIFEPPNTLPDKLLTAIGAAPMEVLKFSTLKRVLPVYGAMERYGEGSGEMALGAIEYALYNTMFKATAGMPRSSQAVIYPSVFASLTAAEGGSEQDVLVAYATGLLLTGVGPQGDFNLSISNQIRSRMLQSETVQKFMHRNAARIKEREDMETLSKELADEFAAKEMQGLAMNLEGMKSGKVEGIIPPKLATDLRALMEAKLGLPDVSPVWYHAETGRMIVGEKGQPHATFVSKTGKEAGWVNGFKDNKTGEFLSHGRVAELSKGPMEAADFALNNLVKKYVDKFDTKGVMSEDGKVRLADAFTRAVEKEQVRLQAAHDKLMKATEEQITQATRRVNARYEKMEERKSVDDRTIMQRTRDWTGRFWLTSFAPARERLRKLFGGEEVIIQRSLVNGAPAFTADLMREWEGKVLRDIKGTQQERDLARHVDSRRTVAIASYKPDIKRPIDPFDATLSFLGLARVKGREYYKKISDAADAHFAWTKMLTQEMRKAGVISKETEFNFTKREYSITEFIDRLDPHDPLASRLVGRQVRVSGFDPLKKGSEGDVVLNIRLQAAEMAARAANRILRNNANKSLYTFAERLPKNGIARNSKKESAPFGFETITSFYDGKPRYTHVPKYFAEAWMVTNPQMTRLMANTLNVLGGGFVVRPLATGFNWAFSMAMFPVDMLHIFMVNQGGVYSSAFPKFLKQHTGNLVATMHDSFRRTGQFTDFVRQGGAPNFLAHQGFERLQEYGSIQSFRETHRVRNALSYFGETLEMWNRLALRRQAMLEGKAPTEASAIARNYLDFSDGGLYAKGLDNLIPYFNASIQAGRGIGRAFKEDPAAASWRVTQLIMLEQLFELGNWLINPEAMRDISYDKKMKFWIITTPFSFQDSEGYSRHLYFTVKKDPSLIPFTGIPTTLTEHLITGRVPPEGILRSLKSALPIPLEGATIPTVSAYYTYADNKNFWGDDVWHGAKVRAMDEIRAPSAGQPGTHPLATLLGRLSSLGMERESPVEISPERIEASFDRLLPDNPITHFLGLGVRKMLEGFTVYDKNRMTEELLLSEPHTRRWVQYTHPLTRFAEFADEEIKTMNSEEVRRATTLNEMYAAFQGGQLLGGVDSIRSWIGNQPLEVQESLHNKLNNRIEVDFIFDRYKQVFPPKTWWLRLMQESPETRAEMFFSEWRLADDAAQRQKMEDVAAAMKGFGGERFWYRFTRLNRDRRTGED